MNFLFVKFFSFSNTRPIICVSIWAFIQELQAHVLLSDMDGDDTSWQSFGGGGPACPVKSPS
jgi:hypothetical protein